MYSIVFFKNKFFHKDSITFPMEERGLQFGDGVYEVIRLYDGKYYLLDDHIDRLYRSLEAIHIQIDLTKEQFKTNLKKLIHHNKMDRDGIVYLQITRGSAPRIHAFPENIEPNIYAYLKDFPRPLQLLNEGVKAITVPDERWENCYIKSLNLLPNVLAKETATKKGAFEAILHRDDTVTEGSSSNIFLVKDGTIYTHPETKRILHGCVRSAVKRFATRLQIPFVQEAFTIDAIKDADELFLTSSTSEIMPIIQVNEWKIGNGAPGNIVKQLQNAYEEEAIKRKEIVY